MLQNKDRKLSRTTIARLIGNAWGKSATVANATAGFRACGIHPFNPQVVPDHFFSISDASTSQHSQETPNEDEDVPVASTSSADPTMPKQKPELTKQRKILIQEPGPSNQEKTLVATSVGSCNEKETP